MRIQKIKSTVLHGNFFRNRALSAMRYLTMQNRESCRHNIGYWTEVAYLGIGLGASSYMEGCRFTNERDLDKYLALDFGSEVPEERGSCP